MSILRCNGVLGNIFLGQRLKPSLRFGGLMLNEAKSLSDYGIHHRCIHQLKTSFLCANEREKRPDRSVGQKTTTEQDQSFEVTWRKEHDKILLGLLIKHIPNGGRNVLYREKDSWCVIVDKFNELTDLKLDYEYLLKRWNEIVNATDHDRNEHIKKISHVELYRKEMPYFDLLEKVFGDK